MRKDILQLKDAIDDGRNGNSIMIPFGFPKMSECTGIGKKLYFLVGGMSGTGKTAFTDLAFVLLPYSWYLKNKNSTDIEIKWIYRSMERSKTYKLAKWLCMRMLVKYNILLDVPTMLRWNIRKSRMSDEIYEKVVESLDFFDKMLEHVEIIDRPINPTGIYKHVTEYARTVGEYEEAPYITKEGILRTSKVYKPNNPRQITIIIIDTATKARGEKSDGRYLQPQSKELLDKLSEYCASEFRDYYGFTPVLVSQFNRGLEDTQRRIKTELHPLPGDFKGTGNMYEDADIVFGMYNPHKLGDNRDLGYNIPRFVNSEGYNRYRSSYILKNSYGVDDIAFGFQFIGECGYMKELPSSKEMTETIYKKIENGEY